MERRKVLSASELDQIARAERPFSYDHIRDLNGFERFDTSAEAASSPHLVDVQ
ncbi:MAG: hypothetical protein ACREA0_25565 [bacterium]